jgi:hypothetical protein
MGSFLVIANPKSRDITHGLHNDSATFLASNQFTGTQKVIFRVARNCEAQHSCAPFDANAVADLSREHQAWLRANLATPFDGKTVVITHFAPSLKSADPRFGITPGTAGFCSHLDDLVAHADVWMHGHLHCRSDYLLNGCRVVSNPLGYAKKGEQIGFDGERVIEVG